MIEQAGDYSLCGWLRDLIKIKAKVTLFKKTFPVKVKGASSPAQKEQVKTKEKKKYQKRYYYSWPTGMVLEAFWVTHKKTTGTEVVKKIH